MNGDPMHLPLGQQVQLPADVEILAKLGDRPVEKSTFAAIQGEQEHRKGAEESVRQGEIQALEEKVFSVSFRRVGGDGLGEALLEERRNGRV